MQAKGSGSVNRVELECQVLCASLRQSCARQDKVGAFTSVRELSHLFRDLLPPPENDPDGSNKANYYEMLTLRHQAGLNSIVIGYLRAVRNFLRDYNPRDYRQFYNQLLNAGFVLRKPRLRLSHDLVVARRWLYESQLEEISAELAPDEAQSSFTEQAEPESQTPASAVEEPAEPESRPRAAQQYQEPDIALEQEAEESPQQEQKESSAAYPQSTEAQADMPQDLAAELTPSAVPDAVRSESYSQSLETAPEAPEAEIPLTESPQAELPPPEVLEPEIPVAEAPPAEIPVAEAPGAEIAASKAPLKAEEKKAAEEPSPGERLPYVIRLLKAAHLITHVEVRALQAQMELAPNISVEQLCINAGYLSQEELLSIRLAESLIASGTITMAQFAVAMYDERTSGLKMAESLHVRGWLESEVANPVEEFRKHSS